MFLGNQSSTRLQLSFANDVRHVQPPGASIQGSGALAPRSMVLMPVYSIPYEEKRMNEVYCLIELGPFSHVHFDDLVRISQKPPVHIRLLSLLLTL